MTLTFPTFAAGLALSLSLIMSIGPQNAHVLRMGLGRQHLGLTVLTCIVSDALLIGLGVLGLAQLGGLSPKVHGALLGAGILFLSVQCWRSARRAWAPSATATTPAAPAAAPMGRRQAVLAALAFSWLNPHAWLDTAVLIGTASLAHGSAGPVFGLGAATGSLIWFGALGVATFWLGQRIAGAHVWRALDAVVALTMGATVAALIGQLF